ncbi:hypothetical protein [uncultured Campylobacter sp.]|uniref:hypothetical protein n=1 Tax=uncultured Campylobacter sp. TaxID=218934 RepID=UPI002607E9EF|nr:hypothetical protein [uncultured Campylobacter sp.]
MKKFYLKISLFAFITAFAATSAAAKSHLTSLIKLEDFNNEEQRTLFKSCDYGEGKYSACNNLVEILSKKCDGGDMDSCATQSDFLQSLYREEEAMKYLIKLCDADFVEYCIGLGWEDIEFNGNIQRAIRSFEKVCDSKLKDSEPFCRMNEELKSCLEDKECNPIIKGKALLKRTAEELK